MNKRKKKESVPLKKKKKIYFLKSHIRYLRKCSHPDVCKHYPDTSELMELVQKSSVVERACS